MKLKMAAIVIIAVVVITALWLTNTVDFKLNRESISLSTEKNPKKDTVSIKKIQKSKVDIKNRAGQDISVEDVNDSSDVKVKWFFFPPV